MKQCYSQQHGWISEIITVSEVSQKERKVVWYHLYVESKKIWYKWGLSCGPVVEHLPGDMGSIQIWKDPTCCWAAKPIATSMEARAPGACALRQQKPPPREALLLRRTRRQKVHESISSFKKRCKWTSLQNQSILTDRENKRVVAERESGGGITLGLTDHRKTLVLREENPPAGAGGAGDRVQPPVRKIPWGRKWHPLWCSCLESPWTGWARRAIVHGVAKWSGVTEPLSTLKKNRGKYDWSTLLFAWTIVNQLYFNKFFLNLVFKLGNLKHVHIPE